MARILITGATGFIGSALADRLYDNGHTVYATGTSNERQCKKHKMVKNDISEIMSLGEIDVLLHQAAHNDTTDENENNMFKSNCLWSYQLFEACEKMKCKKIIYASSASVYGQEKGPNEEDDELHPGTAYATSKAILEDIAQEFSSKTNIPCIGLRYFNVYGIGEAHKSKRASMIFKLCKEAIESKSATIFEYGEQMRDWISIDDVVDFNIKCIEHNKTDIFNVGTGISVSMNSIVKTISNSLSKPISTIYIKNPYSHFYQEHTQASIKKYSSKLNWSPKISTLQGINDLIMQMLK